MNQYIITTINGDYIEIEGLDYFLTNEGILKIKVYEDEVAKYGAFYNWDHIVGIRKVS